MCTQFGTQEANDVATKKFFRIVRLQARNVKRIKAIDITPDGTGVIIVAGNNGEGKTSALDAIMWALAGKDAVAKEPIRRGQGKAVATVDCGDFIASRILTPTGQKLELKAANGEKISQPQTFLDRILGRLSFDPLKFAGMSGRDRVATLLNLIPGLEGKLDEIATARDTLYDDRRAVNHQVRNLTGQLEEMKAPEADWPTEMVSTKMLLEEKNRLQLIITDNNEKRRSLENAETQRQAAIANVAELERQLNEARAALGGWSKKVGKMKAEVERLVDPDISEIDAQIAAASDHNQKATNRAAYENIQRVLAAEKEKAENLTNQITAIEKQKEAILEDADFPVKGLSFADGDVMFNAILFDQLASSEQLRVSLAMAMATNPALRVIRITDGSLLDDKSMEIVRQMAEQHDYQVWIECVGDRADATVVIEDGRVKT